MTDRGDEFWLTPGEVDEVKSIIQSGDLVQGVEVEGFEREFASYIGSKYAIACNSGTSGLHIALLAAGIVPKSEVITTPLSFVATSNAILYSGGIPVFADVNKETLNISVSSIREKIGKMTTAIIGVHLYGFPFDVDEMTELCARDNIVLIEDAAQALGASSGGKKVGTFGQVGVFSFYDTKHLKLGEGGMIVTDDADIAEKCRMIRSHGSRKQYVHEMLGYNYRLNEVFAKIGRIQLKKIGSLVEAKRKRAKLIRDNLDTLKRIHLVKEMPGTESVYYRFPVMLDEPHLRNRLVEAISKETGHLITTGYPTLIYEQSLYRELRARFPMSKSFGLANYRGSLCPIAESLPPRLIEIPTDPWLPEEYLVAILDSFKAQLRILA